MSNNYPQSISFRYSLQESDINALAIVQNMLN